MHRSEDSQDGDFMRAVKIGEENANCLTQMRNWCKHVEIERTSEGLYAQFTGLPIASHSVACPKVEGKAESMNLRWIFSDFLVKHCATCPHHAPNGDTSWGSGIIDRRRKEAQERQQAKEEEACRVSRLREDLRSKSRGISAETEPEAHRILDFLEAIFSEIADERIEAFERLKQSARVGADLFPDVAIDLIVSLAGTKDFSEFMLPVCTDLAQHRFDLGSSLSRTAIGNIESGLHPELSASAIVALGNGISYPLSEDSIERLLLSQEHDYPVGGWKNGKPEYPYSTAALIRSFDADPFVVQSIVRRELQNESAAVRFGLCGAIRLIQDQRPEFIENLLDDFLQSLELREAARSVAGSPSGQIVDILRSAFQYSTEVVDVCLAQAMANARLEVQKNIVRVYQKQFFAQRDRSKETKERSERKEVSESENAAIQRLLEWAKDDTLEIEVRRDSVQALKSACTYAATAMLNHFDFLLGYYAIISAIEEPPADPPKILLPNQRPEPQPDQLQLFRRKQLWDFFKQNVRLCLQEICKAEPLKAFDSVCGCLDNPSEPLEDDFKACCVSLLGELGRDYRLQPRVLPHIWRGLMDYESAWVRTKATHATADMFSSSSTSPPANLVETIIIHLQDSKVGVHQAALRVVSTFPGWFDKRQAIEVLGCLARHLDAYGDDKYQLEKICIGILKISCRNTRLKPVALRMVESVFPTGERYVDKEIAEQLIHFCKPSDRIAGLVAKNIGTYLTKYERDRYNEYMFSDRLRMFEWIHQLPEETHRRVADDLLSNAEEMAGRDYWESMHFASIFANFRMASYEQAVLESVIETLPEEPRFETLRADLYRIAMIAAGNASLQAGDEKTAAASFEKGKRGA